jgi:hypothetical protein
MKFLTILGLAAIVGLAGCKSSTPTNTNTATLNTNTTVTTSTPVVTMTPAATADAAAKSAVEAAMKKAGFNDVTVEATTTEVTIRGTIPKGKMAQVNQIATETGKRKVSNQVVEK